MMFKQDESKIKDSITNIANEFKKITNLQFLCALRPEQCSTISKFLQHVYELAISCDVENQNNVNILHELLLEDMDEEQIWQQLEQRNEEILNKLSTTFPILLSDADELLEVRLKEEDELDSDEDMETAATENLQTGNSIEFRAEKSASVSKSKNTKKQSSKNVRKSVVDDKFFKLSEMETFLKEEDAKEMSKHKNKAADDNAIDYFAEDQSLNDDDADMEHMNYNDFFDDNEEQELTNTNNNNVHNEEYAENKDSSTDTDHDEAETKEKSDEEIVSESKQDQPKSSFEWSQERLKLRIRDYEEEVLGEKPWQLKGEILANNRPQNSLLEQVLEFESTLRPAPVITEQTTQRLEDIIRQRIKEQAWDNVELKVRPLQTPQEYRKQLVLDQEKSKQSLAQVYEADYQRELLKSGQADNDINKITPQQQEIQRLMYDLFTKLDALSNYHLIPKPVAPEVKILTNTPAVNMEEVAPMAVSNAAFLAPEEVYGAKKHELLDKSQRTSSLKKRERRKKGLKQKAISNGSTIKIAEKKLSKIGNMQKISNDKDKGSLKSSKAFFAQLQDKTSNTVNAKKKGLNTLIKTKA